MKTKFLPLLFGALVAFHFAMLLLGVLRVSLPGKSLRDAQILYGRVTGGGGSFGFFSPNVPREIDVDFVVERPGQPGVRTTLQEFAPPEVRARMGNMIRLLGNNFSHDKIVRSVAAALTVAIWRKFPEASSITLNANLYALPSLPDYAAGAREKSVLVYSATFRKGAP